jgi:hypothetical protein
MANLSAFLAAAFFLPLAILSTLAIIDQRRAARRQTIELAHEERLQKAA